MRGKRAKKREVAPDAKHDSALVSRMINYVMVDGKKDVATKLVYNALDVLDVKELQKLANAAGSSSQKKADSSADKGKAKDRAETDAADKASEKQLKLTPLTVLEVALGNIKPNLEIRSRRIGGANYQIPVPVAPDRQISLAMRWLINSTRDNRKGEDFSTTLKNEIEAAYKGEGQAVKKREDTQRMADANKAFAQFA